MCGRGASGDVDSPHTLRISALQISALKSYSVLRALTTEANGWAPAGKVPFRALGAWVGPTSELPMDLLFIV